MNLVSKIESILFVASKPLAVSKIAKAIEVDTDKIEDALETLKMKYNRDDSGINILTEGDRIQMGTNPDNSDVLSGFIKEEISGELTKAQLETLTVVAYRGPITRPELEEIRGVNCAVILRNLMIRGLVEEKDDPEKMLPAYNVSFEALRHLGVNSIDELPDYNILRDHEHFEQQSN
jgi:segregation and condensation protein B